jgi:protein MBA1
MCADGLLRNFEGRISQRPTSERLEWTLHKHLGKPRVVSHRAAPLPEVEGLGIRQAIVRIRSRQSLQRSSQKAAGFEPVVQDKEEYIVIQKRMFEKMEGPWMVWGTVEESDWRKVVL